MDINELAARLTELEARHNFLQGKFSASVKTDNFRITELEVQVEELESRLEDLAYIEKIAFAAYGKTHPEAQANLAEADDAIEAARGKIFFDSLPTIQERNKRQPDS
jgi:hypothetical protein